MSRSVLKFLMVLAATALFTTMAAADSFTFNIAGTIPSSGKYVTSVVTITSVGTSSSDSNRGFDINVVNTTANPSSLTQILDAIQFNLKSGVSLGTLTLKSTGTSAILRDVASNGTYVDMASTGLGQTESNGQIDWGLVSGSAFKLCAGAYNTSSCPMQQEGIIGSPDTNGAYSAAGTPITGSSGSPELYGTLGQPVTFHVYASGVTANTMIANVIDSANFYYGTCGGSDKVQVAVVPTGGGSVPEPASIFLLGSGIAGLATKLRKRKR